MTSRRTSSVTPGSATIVFLDANILAKPVTRTLLMVGGPTLFIAPPKTHDSLSGV
jgi:hypothetical protein